MKRKFEGTRGGDKEGDCSEVEEITIRRRIDFETEAESDSDNEVTINRQAHKRRKMGADMEELKVWFDNKMTEKMANLSTKEQTQTLVDSINENAARGRKNEDDIRSIRAALTNIEDKLAGGSNSYAGKAAVLPSRENPDRVQGNFPMVASSRSSTERTAFLRSRRSLRVWPIAGENEDEIREAVTVFFCQALGTPRKDELHIANVKRVRSAPRGVPYLEVLVEFEDNMARDDILVRGPMLAGYRDKGKPTAGLRLDIPAHLMGVFKTLESFGYELKKKHSSEFKKHIKFDELEESLFLQVGIKRDEQESVDWTEYSALEAKNGLRTLRERRIPRFDYLSSPPGGSRQTEAMDTSERVGTKRKRNDQVASSGFGWVPPPLVGRGGQQQQWRQGQEESNEDTN